MYIVVRPRLEGISFYCKAVAILCWVLSYPESTGFCYKSQSNILSGLCGAYVDGVRALLALALVSFFASNQLEFHKRILAVFILLVSKFSFNVVYEGGSWSNLTYSGQIITLSNNIFYVHPTITYAAIGCVLLSGAASISSGPNQSSKISRSKPYKVLVGRLHSARKQSYYTTTLGNTIVPTAIGLGMVWSDQELIWGGMWNWDPVELTSAIAFVHLAVLSHTSTKSSSYSHSSKFNFPFLGGCLAIFFISKLNFNFSVHAFASTIIFTTVFVNLACFLAALSIKENQTLLGSLPNNTAVKAYFTKVSLSSQTFFFSSVLFLIIGYLYILQYNSPYAYLVKLLVLFLDWTVGNLLLMSLFFLKVFKPAYLVGLRNNFVYLPINFLKSDLIILFVTAVKNSILSSGFGNYRYCVKAQPLFLNTHKSLYAMLILFLVNCHTQSNLIAETVLVNPAPLHGFYINYNVSVLQIIDQRSLLELTTFNSYLNYDINTEYVFKFKSVPLSQLTVVDFWWNLGEVSLLADSGSLFLAMLLSLSYCLLLVTQFLFLK